jgi:hypothetical protein
MNGRCIDDKLVLRAAACIFAGCDNERPGVAQRPFTPAQRRFNQQRGRQIAINGFGSDNAELFYTVRFYVASLPNLRKFT